MDIFRFAGSVVMIDITIFIFHENSYTNVRWKQLANGLLLPCVILMIHETYDQLAFHGAKCTFHMNLCQFPDFHLIQLQVCAVNDITARKWVWLGSFCCPSIHCALPSSLHRIVALYFSAAILCFLLWFLSLASVLSMFLMLPFWMDRLSLSISAK